MQTAVEQAGGSVEVGVGGGQYPAGAVPPGRGLLQRFRRPLDLLAVDVLQHPGQRLPRSLGAGRQRLLRAR
ncbi:hypothetical protein VM98_38980 [Streptomyces rubellomurinus subsp. indigoferus]|nr:hypothetical protein VM98_38980 [Streptomyces rubellomurinus subsp. indigoferus]